ncbi:hypothetical protein LOK49_Contig35G00005 [Camellia lanceoleosa]|nr:hypothetical protein LOK49_Contig35G00005 [Camellia lanceoleosa]
MSDFKFVFLLLILSSLIFSQVSFAINGKEETQEITNGVSYSRFPTRHMNITNDLGAGITLTIRCKSKDDDLGQHDLAFHSSFTWHFKANLFIHNTLFYCYMFWNGVSESFDVFREGRDKGRCAERCWWSIRTDGAYSLNGYGGWDLMYKW